MEGRKACCINGERPIITSVAACCKTQKKIFDDDVGSKDNSDDKSINSDDSEIDTDGATMYIPIPTVYLLIQRPVCGFSLSRNGSYQRTRLLVTILSSLHLPSALGQLAYLFNDLTGSRRS